MKRTTTHILKKVAEWRELPEMVPGVYRLFVFLPWENIPKEYKDSFDPRAEEVWDTDLEDQVKNLTIDTEVTIKAILEELYKKHIVAALALVPIILADLYIYGGKPGALQGKLMAATKDYKETVNYDRPLAEIETLFSVEEIISTVISRMKLKLGFNLEETFTKLLNSFVKPFEQEQDDEFLKSIDKALTEYESKEEVKDEQQESI